MCALVGAFAPALAAGGIKFDAAAPESFPLAQAAGVLRSCAEESIVAMMMAGVNVSALAELNNCGFGSAADVPACLSAEVTGINSANATVTATSRTGGSRCEVSIQPGAGCSGSAQPICQCKLCMQSPLCTITCMHEECRLCQRVLAVWPVRAYDMHVLSSSVGDLCLACFSTVHNVSNVSIGHVRC